MLELIKENNEGKYIIGCRSRFSGSSYCSEDGKIKRFKSEEDAREYAKKMRDLMGVNYHYWVEVDESVEMTEEFEDLRVSEVSKLPNCDFCNNLAKYDGKTKIGPWAYMCERHFKEYGVGLGTGLGQKLVVKESYDDNLY